MRRLLASPLLMQNVSALAPLPAIDLALILAFVGLRSTGFVILHCLSLAQLAHGAEGGNEGLLVRGELHARLGGEMWSTKDRLAMRRERELSSMEGVEDSGALSVRYRVEEEVPVGTQVGDLRELRQLRDTLTLEDLAALRFRFLSESGRMFAVEERSGVVRTAARLDREALCRQKDICEVTRSAPCMSRS